MKEHCGMKPVKKLFELLMMKEINWKKLSKKFVNYSLALSINLMKTIVQYLDDCGMPGNFKTLQKKFSTFKLKKRIFFILNNFFNFKII